MKKAKKDSTDDLHRKIEAAKLKQKVKDRLLPKQKK